MPPNDTDAKIEALRQEMLMLIATHQHDGGQATRIDLDTSVFGLFETVSAVPTAVPANLYDQIKIYKNSTTYRLYWYDGINNQWRYATGT